MNEDGLIRRGMDAAPFDEYAERLVRSSSLEFFWKNFALERVSAKGLPRCEAISAGLS